MKTTKFFSILSLVLILVGINAAYPKNKTTDTHKAISSGFVSYAVNVHFVADDNLCNVYLVQITDEQGNLVAPVQRYEPGVSRYIFREEGQYRGNVRIANLVRAMYPNHYVCAIDLYTVPAIKQGPFLRGHAYTFDLYPVIEISKVKNTPVSDQ